MKEADRRRQELERQMERTERKISSLGTSVGNIVENMVGGDIVEQFRKLRYAVVMLSRNVEFGEEGSSMSGEIDLYLEDGDVAIHIEAKTTFKTAESFPRRKVFKQRNGKLHAYPDFAPSW